jgi:hypothetical protein
LIIWSMIRMFAWWGTNASMSSAVTPAASRAFCATGAICQTAHLKTDWPSWRSVGQPAPSSRVASHECVCRMAWAWLPSEPQMVGPMPGVSDGPMTTAPAPSPSRNEMVR